MTEQKKLTIRIGKDGSVTSEVSGVKGESCLEMTNFLDKIFGGKEKTALKNSYHETETETVKISDGLPSGWCG